MMMAQNNSEMVGMGMETTADRKKSYELGVRCWREVYRGSADDALAMKRIRQILFESLPIIVNNKTGEQREADEDHVWDFSMIADVSFLAMWVDNACARLETSHRYASALMCTSSDKDVVDEIELPWKAFAVTIPSGLVEYPSTVYSRKGETIVATGTALRKFREVRIATIPYWNDINTMTNFAYLRAIDEDNGCLRVTANTVADLLFDDITEINGSDATIYSDEFVPNDDADRRALTMIKRLVAGLLLAFAHTNNFRDKRYGTKGIVDPRDGKPEHRVIQFGRPIDVDCRPAVKAYLQGRRRGLPNVQTLVRGHHKRQVIGIGRTGRKVIWIEPYWKGPKDAPILSHSYIVGNDR